MVISTIKIIFHVINFCSFRSWLNPTDVRLYAADIFQRGRHTIHYPMLNKNHCHNFIGRYNRHQSTYPHLQGPRALNRLCEFMLSGSEVLDLEFGVFGRDKAIYEEFLLLNRADRCMEVNNLSVEKLFPGGPVLLDSLIVESAESRYKIPHKLYLEDLQAHRAVDRFSLNKVKRLVYKNPFFVITWCVT